MKRVLGILLLFMLVLSLAACGAGPVKEAPAKKQETPAKDIRNMEELYAFVNREIYEVARDAFETHVEKTFLDVTGNGYDEAILVNNTDWSTNIAIVTAEGAQFKHIPTEVSTAKYANNFAIKDGFLVVTQKTGGTGVQIEYMSLAVYSQGKMVTVLKNLTTAETMSQPGYNVNYEDISDIKGGLEDFEYTLRRLEGDKVKTTRKALYSYNKEKLAFDVIEVDLGKGQTGETGHESGKPSLKAEKHREAYIDYNKYDLVVIDSYGMDSLRSLEYFKFNRPGAQVKDELGYNAREIAIVGQVYDLYYHSACTGENYKIADQLGNKILYITDDVAKENSLIAFKDKSGYEYSLEMFGEFEEQFETILVKGDQRQFLGTNDREARPGDRTEPADFSSQASIHISELINGDSVGGGLIIKNINRPSSDKARFTLEGSIVLTGDLHWDEMMMDEPLFIADESNFPTAIVIGDPKDSLMGTIDYKPVLMYFRNPGAVEKVLSKSDLEQLKSGKSMRGQIGVRDFKVNIYLGSEGGADCEFTEIVDLKLL